MTEKYNRYFKFTSGDFTQTFMSKQKYLGHISAPDGFKRTLMKLDSGAKNILMVTKPSHKAIAEKFCELFSINCTVRISDQITGMRATSVIFDENFVADTGRMMTNDERLREAMQHGYKAGLLK